MDCLSCKNKYCKLKGQDCISNLDSTGNLDGVSNINSIGNLDSIIAQDGSNKNGHDASVAIYNSGDNKSIYKNADSLVADGRAGKLSRLDEIIEFCKIQEYSKVSIAYCYSMEKESLIVKNILESNDINTESFRCTISGVREHEILCNGKNIVNCNPAGQALAINKSSNDFVIEMGLCMGHDVIFHKYLLKPFTVFAVKDRVYKHNPLAALTNYSD